MSPTSKKGTAVVTGASTGIGAVYAERLARRGYDLVLVARDAAKLAALAASLQEAAQVNVEVLPADLTLPDGRARVERRLAAGDVTMLVNNAGMAASGVLTALDPDAIDSMIQLNVIAVARLAAAAARNFGPRGAGVIINVASVLALAPELFNGVYSGTKAFVLNLSQSMQQELGPLGVRVQAVLPGATLTEIWERSGTDIAHFPPGMLMGVDEMVDAALAGLDIGEPVTIPSLPDAEDFAAFNKARQALGPNLSRDHAAARYKISAVS